MHVFNVVMPGSTPSAAHQEVEELGLGLRLPSYFLEGTYGTKKASHQTNNFTLFRRRTPKCFYLLPAVAIMLLLLNMYLCRLKKSRNIGAGGRSRKMASGEEEEEGNREAGLGVPHLCGLLEEAVSPHEEQDGPDRPSPHTPAALFEVVVESKEEKPQQRKRRTKLHEQGAAVAGEDPKRAKAEPLSLPTSSSIKGEEDMFTVVEQTVTAAIEALGPALLAEWEMEFSEDLLWTPLPEISPQGLPDSGESEAPLSEEKDLQLLLKAAEQLQGELQLSSSSASPPLLEGDHTYAAQQPPELAWISSEQDRIRADHSYAAQQPSALAQFPSELQSTEGDHSSRPQDPSASGPTSSEQHSQELQRSPLNEATAPASGLPVPGKSPAPVPATSQVQLEAHPYYRLPRGWRGGRLELFDANTTSPYERGSNLPGKLLGLRKIFAKENVSFSDAATLMIEARSLLHHAAQWNPGQLEGLSPYKALASAARRFLLADAVWCVCAVVGPSMNQEKWWDGFMAHVAIPESVETHSLPPGSVDWRPFIGLLRSAIEEYRHGRRPSAERVVALKQVIFCHPSFIRDFKSVCWDPWRKDDKDFGGTSGINRPLW